MSVALVSNPIKISDGNWGEFIDLAGVMKELMNEVVEYLKSKGRGFLEDVEIHYGTNNPFNRSTQANHQEILYDLDYIQVDLLYSNVKKTYDSFYLKIYSTRVKNNRHEVLRFFRVADHIHQERTLGTKTNLQLPKDNSKIIKDGMRWELVAFSVEEIREAIQEAIDKLNEFLEEEYAKLNHDTNGMIDEISELSKN